MKRALIALVVAGCTDGATAPEPRAAVPFPACEVQPLQVAAPGTAPLRDSTLVCVR